ncbi:MAG TPA: hypothetical protein VIQ74_14245 [Gemmatimonadaceae bacterium]
MMRRLVALPITLALAALAACGSDNSTQPTPPEPPPAPPDTIQLTIASVVGTRAFPAGNTERGGDGATIDGIACDDGASDYHIHAHVSLFVKGEQIAIPEAIGVKDPQTVNNFVVAGRCWYWIHTHDATGIIHVEPPTQIETSLGQLFDIWGQPLSKTEVAGYQGPVTVSVDGESYTGDPRAITFESHRQITLQVGTPLVTPPVYIFPPTY